MIRWGILGCGDVTEIKSGPGFQQARGSSLTAVMRRTPGLARDYAGRHGVPRWYERAEDLIADPEVDAVYIATPPGSHLEHALQVCAAGKPAYVEKPMARSSAECARMVEAFAAARLPLFVAYYRRALPRFLKARDLLHAGALGVLSHVAYRFTRPLEKDLENAPLPWRVQEEHAGGGHFLDLGCHTLDILDFLLGPLQSVSGHASHVAAPYAVEDTVALCFGTASGASGTASWDFVGGMREDLIEITGTEGRLSFSTFSGEPVLLRTRAGEVRQFDIPNPIHIQQPLIQTIVDALEGRGACPSDGVSATRTSRVMDIALESYYGGRADPFWERPDTWPGAPRKKAPDRMRSAQEVSFPTAN